MYPNIVLFFMFILGFPKTNSAHTINRATQYNIEYEWNERCRNETYCTIPSKRYPATLIRELLQVENFNIISVNTGRKMYNTFVPTYKMPVNLCEAQNIFDPIYEIIDSRGNLRYVIQSNFFKQLITLEKCVNPGRVDSHYILSSDNPYVKFSCREKRINYKFLVLSEDQNFMEWVPVANGIPVSCYCFMEET